ncbi:glutamate receptor ionotropic, delta-2-like [Portunus trituberculatus]|uniref:glutamate receptor ionotropic, delta-2-like n=1 Tax=Portunus trituberculatus TaxID=210409 RepID=UPI001E1CC2F8|nr:glutamate receptor ionotropic, delta-2-like [Portunus trituberculatus]
MEALAKTEVGRKTEHLVGLVQMSEGWKMYENQLFREPAVRRVDSWSVKEGRQGSRRAILFPSKLTNLQGTELKVVWFQFSPHFMVGPSGRYGRDYKVVMALSEALNFTPAFRKPSDGVYYTLSLSLSLAGQLWGQASKNGSWSGLVGTLARGEANFGLANVFLANPDGRREVHDFSSFYDSDVACFLGRSAGPVPRWQSLARPFSLLTWVAVLATLVFAAIALFIITLVSSVEGPQVDHTFHSLSYVLLYTWGIHLREPQVGAVKGAGMRTAVLTVWVYAVVLTIAYSTNLTASLTVAKVQPAVNTFRGLRQSGQRVFAMGTFFRLGMAASENPDLKVLADRLEPYPNLPSALRPVEAGYGVFIQSRKYLEFLVSDKYSPRGVPSMRILRECFAPYSIAVSLEKNSPLCSSFDVVLRNVFEGGLVRRWFVEALRLAKRDKKGKKDEETMEKAQEEGGVPLSVDHLQGVFLILALVLLVVCLAFLTELSCGKRNRRNI